MDLKNLTNEELLLIEEAIEYTLFAIMSYTAKRSKEKRERAIEHYEKILEKISQEKVGRF
jgi:hypothetical protein